MQIIETTAPISLENLKVYFKDKNTLYLINYEESQLKEEVLLTYIGNIEIPCDIVFKEKSNLLDMVQKYLHFKQIINVPILEMKVIDILFQFKGLIEAVDKEFIDANQQILEVWAKKLDSLTLYNMWMIDSEEFKDYVRSFPTNETDSIEGINFVSLLKHESFYDFYSLMDESKLEYYPAYFNDYMFKGNSIYAYWANESNPMFLLTWSIASGNLDNNEFISALRQDQLEIN